MAENVKQKNKIFSFQKYSKMPYEKAEYIQYGNGNTAIDSIQLENSVTQLVQNDLYIKNKLMAQEGFVIGPNENDDDGIYYGENGYKVWVINDEETSIYRKDDVPLQNTIEINPTMVSKIRFICDVDNRKILIASNQKTYVSDSDFRKLEFKNIKYQGEDIEIYARSNNKNNIMFSYYCLNNFGIGRYREMLNELLVYDYNFESLLTSDVEITALDYENETGMLYYSTEDGIYSAKYSELQNKFVDIKKIYSCSNGQKVNTIRFLQDKHDIHDIIATFSDKQLRVSFKGNTLLESSVKNTTYDVNSHCILNGRALLFTSMGLIDNDQLVYNLSAYEDKNLIHGTTDGQTVNSITKKNLFEYSDRSSFRELKLNGIDENENLLRCHYIQNRLFIVTDNNIYFQEEYHTGKFKKISIQGGQWDKITHSNVIETPSKSHIYLATRTQLSSQIVSFRVQNNLSSFTFEDRIESENLGNSDIEKINTCPSENSLVYFQRADSKLSMYRLNLKNFNVEYCYDGTHMVIPNEMYKSDPNGYVFIDKMVDNKFMCGFNDATWLDVIDVYNNECTPTYMYYYNGKYKLCFTDGTNSYITEFEIVGFGNGMIATPYSPTDHSINNILHIKDNNYLLVSNNEILNYTFDKYNGQITDFAYQSLSADNLSMSYEYETDETKTYYVSKGNQILSSDNTRMWNHFLYVPNEYNVGDNIDSMMIKNSKNMLFSSQGLLFYTNYKYQMINDTPKFTEESAYALYEDQKYQIDNTIEGRMDQHISQMHTEASAVIHQINKFTSTQFEITDDTFTQGTAEIGKDTKISLSCDYIEKMYVGNQSDETILCWGKNSANGKNPYKLKCNYIAKCWNSGMVELYINIPTTNTYYIPNIPYAGNCKMPNGDTVKVNGRTLNPNIGENYTTLELNILSTFFTIQNVSENTIKGSSLPLKIYKDAENYQIEEGQASLMFHTFMQPSVAMSLYEDNALSTNCDYYGLKYYCFGTDEQNILIQYFDKDKNYLKKYKTVVYHGNGVMNRFNGSDTVVQRILEGDENKPVYSDIFKDTDLIFLGWSSNKKSKQVDFEYTSLSYDMPEGKNPFNGDRLDLYAIWLNYKFSDKDTNITLDIEDSGQTATIDEMNIDSSLIKGLGENVVIDWDSNTNK